MGQKPCFIAVHFGAGFHSKDKENSYKKLMESCCINTLQKLESTDNLIDSLVLGIKILEVTQSESEYCQNKLWIKFRTAVY